MYVLDIAEVAERSGLTASTLRYYEKRGLIASDSRNGLRRQYDDTVLTQLALIRLGQKAGYSLDEIAELFRPRDGVLKLSPSELRRQADDLRMQAKDLHTTAALLDHIAACTAPSHLECPRFQNLLKATHSARPLT
ncbi:DNA-binding transcriptional regulator, MerR family [Aliiroseovarius halocynthiae]|uniref:MerR family transcriptional regulator n=1 Tax=Aliiroseovarius halocynthiae TaxID=985055 RepID=A0A545SSL3_9RHOB|nr:helix-turn-helix domain-containing protein [Aliiroseovarius halocynthiae]TQV67916.1 MerR family transcriptional regulator [Aliiroseovarius halocynthiae]SMR73016.1 DNA-binding transcriptional regulator, MerR family [Aliiroseovarius halocynthiae]